MPKSPNNDQLSQAGTVPGGSTLLSAISGRHASNKVQQHALFTYFFFPGATQRFVAQVYGKSVATINAWKQRWETLLKAGRRAADTSTFRKFTKDKREWIVSYYEKYPLTFLDEGCVAFADHWKESISITQLWRILEEAGYSWKEAERRAKHIRLADIARFATDLSFLNWCPSNVVFLDEVSFDSRDMVRTRGYAPKGQRLIIKGDAGRSKRISLLCFVNVHGLVESFITEGTFTRALFFQHCREFALSGKVHVYPGVNSIWIMDGARIHCDPHITNYLRALGIMVVFLPAYCPFFNPIEPFFGVVKGRMRRFYRDGAIPFHLLPLFVGHVLASLRNFNMRGLFSKAGYASAGCFDPTRAYTPAVDVSCRGLDQAEVDAELDA